MRIVKVLFPVLAVMSYLPSARATIQISYQEVFPAGAVTVCATGTDAQGNFPGISCSAAISGATLQFLTETSNSPGGPNDADQESSTLKITTTAPVMIDIWFSAQDFTFPTAPPPLFYQSSIGLTSNSKTGKGGLTLTSCADTSNGLAPPFCSGAGSPELFNAPILFSGTGSASNTVNKTVTALSAKYSLEQELQLALGANTSLTFSLSQTLTPVPEPATILLLGTGLLWIATLIRKKIVSRS